jgi:hypothetical protein
LKQAGRAVFIHELFISAVLATGVRLSSFRAATRMFP